MALRSSIHRKPADQSGADKRVTGNMFARRERNLAWAMGQCLEPALRDVDVVVAPSYGPAWKSDLTLGHEVV